MDAAVLYLATTVAVLALWHSRIRRVSWAAAAALVLLPLCLTGRALLTGGVYGPIDLPYMAEPLKSLAPRYGVTIHNATLSDLYAQIIPWQHAVREAWAAGRWPLWNPHMLCGDILAATFQPAIYDPFNVLGLLISEPGAVTYSASITFFLCAFSTFVFARELELREQAALIAAAAWMFCSMMTFLVGWPAARSWAVLPLVLVAVRLLVRAPSLRNALLLTIALTFLTLTGHPETLLHVVAIGGAYGIFELAHVRKDLRRVIAYAVAAGVVTLLLSAVALMPFLEAVPLTHEYGVRNGIYKHTQWPPMPDVVKKRIANSFLPEWREWDPNNWRAGAVALTLALLALAWNRRRETWFFLILGILCAWSGANALPVARILHALPLFDVALNEQLAFAASFSIAMLAAIAVDAWPATTRMRMIGVCVAALIAAALLLAWQKPLIAAEVVPLAAVIILLAARTPARVALPILCALILIQRAIVDGGVYPTLPRSAFYPDVPLLDRIPRGDRFAGIGFTLIPNGATMYGLEDARGYEAMTFERLYATYSLWSHPQIASFNVIDDPSRPFLAFLNVRWFLKDLTLIENRNVLPRAFVPQEIRFEHSAMPSMLEGTDFRKTAWIEVPEQSNSVFDNAGGSVRTTQTGNGLDLDATMNGDGWIVISETAWPGWRAYVDGRRVRWRFANHAFLGVYVPRGAHRVRLRYLPDSFVRGRAISVATLALLVIGLAARRRLRARPRPA